MRPDLVPAQVIHVSIYQVVIEYLAGARQGVEPWEFFEKQNRLDFPQQMQCLLERP